MSFADDFDGPELDRSVWLPHYLPMWSSREATRASYRLLEDGGHLEIRCSMTISPRSMAAFWLCGFEDEPEHCGEICVTEVFGKDVVDGEEVRRCPAPPTHPLQLMVAVFDFPDWSTGDDDDLVPSLAVDRISGS